MQLARDRFEKQLLAERLRHVELEREKKMLLEKQEEMEKQRDFTHMINKEVNKQMLMQQMDI